MEQIALKEARALKSPHNKGHYLRPDAATAWERAVKKFKRAVLLTSSWRSLKTQETLFFTRFAKGKLVGPNYQKVYRWYRGSWWTLKKGYAVAAPPGTSNHGGGLAVDVRTRRTKADPPNSEAVVFTSWNDADRLAFAKVAREFGWLDTEGRHANELWHFTYYPEHDKWRNKTWPAQRKSLSPELIKKWQLAYKHTPDGVISRPSRLIRAVQQSINSANKVDKFLSKPLRVDGYDGPLTRDALVRHLNWLDKRKDFFSGAALHPVKDRYSKRLYWVLDAALNAGRITPKGY